MQFVKGQSGNVKGRPKTTGKSLSEAVLKDRLKAYELYFKALLSAARKGVNNN